MPKQRYKIVKRNDLYYIKKPNGKFATWKDFDIETAFPTTPAIYQIKSQAISDLKRLKRKQAKDNFVRKWLKKTKN